MVKKWKNIMAWVLVTVMTITPLLSSLPVLKVSAAEPDNISWDSLEVTKGGTDQAGPDDNGYTINGGGDVFAVSDVSKNSFSYQAEVKFNEIHGAAALIFGVKEKTAPTQYSVVANINPESGEARLFKFKNNGASDLTRTVKNTEWIGQDHFTLKVEVVDGQVMYYINDKIALSGSITDYVAGYIGIMGWNSNITYSDAVVSDMTGITPENTGDGSTFISDLTNWKADRGIWQITENGLQGTGLGNSAIYSNKKASNFIFETDMTVNSGGGGSSIIFRADKSHTVYYAADIAYWPGEGRTATILKYYRENNVLKDKELVRVVLDNQATDTYKLKIEAIEDHITFTVNDQVAFDGTDDTFSTGYFGLNVCDMTTTFNNVKYQEVPEGDFATLTGLTISNDLETDQSFDPAVLDYTLTVPYNVDSIQITPELSGDGTIKVNGKSVDPATQSDSIDLKFGTNLVKIKVISTATGLSKTTTLHILKNYNPDVIYDLIYRPQYHYSPQANWSNDPNGMVYFNDEYHLFYQYYPDDSKWGPMHWGHAVSKDLLHWTELPIAMYPDADGDIFSGSIVVDENNSSGFFEGVEGGGLVAIFTHNNEPKSEQYQSLAYSRDAGRTWTKYKDNPVLPASADPLENSAFRDPKVFWNKEAGLWMLVVAGGPLRLFSSENLIDWKAEGAYPDLHTECPDLSPLKVEGTDETKWVLSCGGQTYYIGRLEKINEKWEFIPETDRLTMNFAKDSYAGQTYNNITDGRTIIINWMNNWDYCNEIKQITGVVSNFNGVYTLQHELKLKKNSNGDIRLYQDPIEEYKELRNENTKVTIKDTVKPAGTNLLKDFSGNVYEIVAEFTPTPGTTEVGFKLRTGKGQETIVYYDISKETLNIDRTNAGKVPIEGFARNFSQETSKTADGKIKMRIFVDATSVEVFGNEGQTTGAAAIFPDFNSSGAEVYTKGGNAQLDLTLYPLESIWKDNRSNLGENPAATTVLLDSPDVEMNPGDTLTVNSKVIPAKADQKVTWAVGGDNVSVVEQAGDTLSIKANKVGEAKLTATTANGIATTITVSVVAPESGFLSNLKTWKKSGGVWSMNEAGYTGTHTDNGFIVGQGNANDYVFETDATYHSGQAFGLIFRASGFGPTGYVVNIDTEYGGGTTRIFTMGGGTGNIGKSAPLNFKLKDGDKLHLKLDVEGNHFKFYINEKLYLDIIDTNNNFPTGEYAGLYIFKASATYQNAIFTPKTTTTNNNGGSSSGGSQSTTEAAAPSLKGWDKVTEQLKDAKAGAKVTASDITTGSIPSTVLNTIKGKDITLQIPGKDYTWSINGKNITGTVKTNTDITVEQTNKTEVQAAGVNQFVAKTKQVTQFQVPGTSSFGFKGTLSISVGKSYAGKTLYLSAYNTKTKRLEVKGTAKVNEDGTVSYSVSEPGKYIITSVKPSTLQVAQTKKLAIGKSAYLKVNNVTKSAKVTYKTSNKSIATVSKTGKITGIKKGKVVITTKVQQGGKTYTFKTTVTIK